ncbi:MAG: hypothetical protein Ct9H300mP8_06870 [Gammaproteobacteria bacterium]|nr:MAG: hypothetical protein Ct9H300mP8_06870 [Gammaproteobacteria bacterium]
MTSVLGLGFAGMLEGLGQVGEAIEEVRRLVRENPDEGSAWRRLAMLLHPTDVIAALDAARTAQGIDNDDISGALLAAVAMKARSYALAVSTYEELTAGERRQSLLLLLVGHGSAGGSALLARPRESCRGDPYKAKLG